MIDQSVVEKVATLARLDLSDTEKNSMVRDMTSIIEYVELLSAVDTDGVEPTAYMVPDHDPIRDDIPYTSTPKEDALFNGPKVKSGFFAVPKVIG